MYFFRISVCIHVFIMSCTSCVFSKYICRIDGNLMKINYHVMKLFQKALAHFFQDMVYII